MLATSRVATILFQNFSGGWRLRGFVFDVEASSGAENPAPVKRPFPRLEV